MALRMKFFLSLVLISKTLSVYPAYAQDAVQGNLEETAIVEVSAVPSIPAPQSIPAPKKKVLILTTSGGGGHTAATQAVRESLEDRYEVTSLDIIGQLPLFQSGAKLFDNCFSAQNWTLMNVLLALPKIAEDVAVLHYKQKIIELITRENSDLIVSVLPTANYVYLNEAKHLGIPMIVIPTDFTPTEFFHKIKNTGVSQDLTVILPFEEPKTLKFLNKRHLNNLSYDGYPVRSVFAEVGNKLKTGDSDLAEELKDYSLTQFYLERDRGDKAILLSMGAKGFGGKLIQQYANAFLSYGHTALSSPNAHLHLLIACGSNKELLNQITELRDLQEKNGDSPRIHLHPFGWINGDQMAKTIAISDAVITKPGGGTVAETIAVGRFMLLLPDSTGVLRWERANLELVVANHWGQVLNRLERNQKNVTEVMAQIKAALEATPSVFPENHFHEKFSLTVDTLMGNSIH